MVKFKKISSSLKPTVKAEVRSTDYEDISCAEVLPVKSSVLAFIVERFLPDKYKISAPLLPDALVFDADVEEVYLLQVPKSYDVEGLVGKKVNLGNKRTKLGEGGGASGKCFEIVPMVKQMPTQVVTQVTSNGQHVLTAVKPAGVLVVRESVKETDFGEGLEDFLTAFDEAENAVIRVPTDLKVRHPLLGADYKKELATRAQALLLLNKRIKKEQSDDRSPKKVKKRKAPPEEEEEEEPQEDQPKPEKKRKKKKQQLETTADLQWLENI